MTQPLRKITGKRLRHDYVPVEYSRRISIFDDAVSVKVKGHRRVRRFSVYLECGHTIEVPFGRRPQIGRQIRCYHCEEIER